MSNKISMTMTDTLLNKKLWATLALAMGVVVSGCSSETESESHEVMAIDRVDAAATLANSKAPEAEKMDFPETAPVVAATDATMTAEATTDADMAVTTDTAVAGESDVDSTDMPAADTATAVEPAAATAE